MYSALKGLVVGRDHYIPVSCQICPDKGGVLTISLELIIDFFKTSGQIWKKIIDGILYTVTKIFLG
jgi:hypothetical protein